MSRLIIFILAMSFSLSLMAETYSSLTPAEREILQTRKLQHSTEVINVDHPKEQQLLHSPSRAIAPNSPDLNLLIEQMRLTVKAQNGNGIAAVQLAIPVRVALLERLIGSKTGDFQVFINPEIVSTSKEKADSFERCLSLSASFTHHLKRFLAITVRYINERGENQTETLKGVEAAVFQQELDHLNGILLSDHH